MPASPDNINNINAEAEAQENSPAQDINWQEKCIRLQHQISVLKEVSTLRKSLLELRGTENKALISKLKYLDDEVSVERRGRKELLKRVETAEIECIELKDKLRTLRRNHETLEKLKAQHEDKLSSSVANFESCELKCKQQSVELEETTSKNSQLNGQLEEIKMKLKENEKNLKGKDNKLKIATDRNQFLSCQVSLINELLHENEDVPIDLKKIKIILKESEDIKIKDDNTDEDEGVELSSLIEDETDGGSQDEYEDLPGEESCYKMVDTKNGPQLILSVSRTFIKLKDLILEKRSLQKEIDNLKNLNTKLESKVDKQEHRLYCVTKEVNKTWSLVSTLKQQQDRFHNSEALLKYELKEKRVLLERLKVELLGYRDKWRKVREKNSESQCVWQQLRDEFAQRREESSSRSLSSCPESEASVPSDVETCPSSPTEDEQRNPFVSS